MSKGAMELFEASAQEGLLSQASLQALRMVDVGAQIQAGLGVKVDDVKASEVVLVSLLIDDSGSIRFVQGNTEAVRQGHNTVLDDVLANSKQAEGILAYTIFLNGELINPYTPLEQAVRLNSHNYNPAGGTPLFDMTAVLLGTVLAKTQEFADNGVPCRTISCIITDGHDEHSVKLSSAAKLKPVVTDMLMQENHIIAAMGITDGLTDFQDVFGEMGILPEWIIVPTNTPSEIRKAFQLVSKSVVRASQSGKSFSEAAMGGFGK